MRLTPNQICTEPGCGRTANHGCDSWDDEKHDYCDRPVCELHTSHAHGISWNWCPKHAPRLRSMSDAVRAAQAPLSFVQD